MLFSHECVQSGAENCFLRATCYYRVSLSAVIFQWKCANYAFRSDLSTYNFISSHKVITFHKCGRLEDTSVNRLTLCRHETTRAAEPKKLWETWRDFFLGKLLMEPVAY